MHALSLSQPVQASPPPHCAVLSLHRHHACAVLRCTSVLPQNVRERAAANLGALTKMSARVDQLATDLANSARTAEREVGQWEAEGSRRGDEDRMRQRVDPWADCNKGGNHTARIGLR